MRCPTCRIELAGLGTYCYRCEAYTDDMACTTDASPEARDMTDDRPEAEIRRAIRAALEYHGFVVVDLEQGYRPGTRRHATTRVRKGLADLYVMGHGTSAWVEVKSATGRQTPDQQAFQRDCELAGVPYYLWRHEAEALLWAQSVSVA